MGHDRVAGCPVTDRLASRHHLEQHLVASQRPKLTYLDYLNPVTDPANPRYLHLSPPEAPVDGTRPGINDCRWPWAITALLLTPTNTAPSTSPIDGRVPLTDERG
jgi:hypothetical protein